MASFVYNLYKQQMMRPLVGGLGEESIGLADTGKLKCALLTSSYPSGTSGARDHTHTTVMGYEVTGTTNYAVATLASLAVGLSTNQAYFDAADVTWSNSTIPDAQYAYIYWEDATLGTQAYQPICVIDFGSAYSSTSADFTIQWNAAGIMIMVHMVTNGCYIYNNAKVAILSGEYAWTHPSGDGDTDSIKVALHTSSYSPLPTHETFGVDTTNEVSGTGYTAGGVVLAGKTGSIASNTQSWTADPAQWTSATFTARYATIYNDDVTDDLIAVIDLQENKTATNGLFRITWNASGIVTFG